jgi:site-specific DNA-methyltransferase (adenine-specific)
LVSSTEPFFHFVKGDGYKYYPDKFMAKNGTRSTTRNNTKIGTSYIQAIKSSQHLSNYEKMAALHELEEVMREVKSGNLSSFRMKIRGIHSAAYGGYDGGRKMHIEKKGLQLFV